MIMAHNSNSSSKFKMGHNQFSTMTSDEMSKWRGNPAMYSHKKSHLLKWDEFMAIPKLDTSSLASSVDWRTEGAVNPVKNQG